MYVTATLDVELLRSILLGVPVLSVVCSVDSDLWWACGGGVGPCVYVIPIFIIHVIRNHMSACNKSWRVGVGVRGLLVAVP